MSGLRTEPGASLLSARRYVRSHMGLVHAVAPSGERAICGTALRDSWEPAEVADWAGEPDVCRSCDDVLMGRGRRAAS